MVEIMDESESQVLVVDDDPIALAQLEERLSEMGYDVATRARALGTSSWILKNKPWLVVLDLEMPALSGQELADFLKSKGLDTPIIIHSGKPEEELRRAVRITGALGAIQKGLSDAQFGLQFNSLVKAARTRKSLPTRRRTASASRREAIGGVSPNEKRSSTGARRIGVPDGASEQRPPTDASGPGGLGESD